MIKVYKRHYEVDGYFIGALCEYCEKRFFDTVVIDYYEYEPGNNIEPSYIEEKIEVCEKCAREIAKELKAVLSKPKAGRRLISNVFECSSSEDP